MSNRYHSVRSITLLVVLFAGCDIVRYAPSSAFIVQDKSIYGIYSNMDVDSAIYGYRTDLKNETEFWSAIDESAAKHGWTNVETSDDYRRYNCIVHKRGQRFHSVEEVRISYAADSSNVIVAWVQTDHLELPKTFPKDGPEGRFAERVIWPRFAQETAKAKQINNVTIINHERLIVFVTLALFIIVAAVITFRSARNRRPDVTQSESR